MVEVSMITLKEKYREEVVPKLKESLGVANIMQIPRCSKITINMGVGTSNRDNLEGLCGELAKITGQRPVITKARKSISNFKLREGMTVGAKVTLRRDKMYEFLDRLINVALPRIRDFRGISANSFDGRGNYTLGIRDQSIFAEIDPNDVVAPQGMDVTIVTTAHNDAEAKEMLELMGMPFTKK